MKPIKLRPGPPASWGISFILLILSPLCSVPRDVYAETAYVIDKLLVGVHKEKSIDSEIVKVLPTGTQVEVLERDGELARIKEPGGLTGWVDAGYLMGEQPAALVVEALEKQNKELTEALGKAQSKIAELSAGAQAPGATEKDVPEQIKALRKERDELKQRLASERLHNGELQAKISELSNIEVPADAEEIHRLREENTMLHRRLGQTGGGGDEAAGPVIPADNDFRVVFGKLLRSKALAFSFLGLLLLAFGGGVYFMDVLNRRRHGGFRL